MIYLIGGAPRSGKTILGQRLARRIGGSWISTDVLCDLLRAKCNDGPLAEWDASPQAVNAAAKWFFPCLQQFIWGVASLAESYVIEGVLLLPAQAAELATKYPVRYLFLGCSIMTVEKLDRFPGRSKGYAALPDAIKKQIAADVPRWSRFIEREAQMFGLPFLDVAENFEKCIAEGERLLLTEYKPGRENG